MTHKRSSTWTIGWTLLIGLLILCTPTGATEIPGGTCESRRPLMEDNVSSDAWALLGVSCFNEGKYVPALIYYRRAYSQSKSPVLVAALGRTLQELGLPGLAETYYQTYLEQSPNGSNRARIQRRLKAVQKDLKVAHRLRIQSNPPGAMVYLVLDGVHWEPLGPSPTAVSVLPRRYVIAFQEPTHHTAIERVNVDGATTLQAELVSHQALFNLTTRKLQRRATYLGLTAAPFLGGGVALLWMGRDNEERARADLWQRPSEYAARLDDAYHQQNLGVGLIATGATLGVVAGAMALVSVLWETEDSEALRVTPTGQLSIAF